MVGFGARGVNIVVYNAPNQSVVLAYEASHGGDWHGLGEHHDQGFEQQCEAAFRSGPGDRHAVDAAGRTFHAGSAGVEESLVLEKVNALSTLAPQVPPSQFGRVVGFRGNPANRARKDAAPWKIQMDIQWRKS